MPSPLLLNVIRAIDRVTNFFGQAVALLIVPLVVVVMIEVVARYGFDYPTPWAFDLSYMLYSSIFMLGASFALMRGAHIRTDMLWDGFTDRTKGIIDATAYLLFFFPALVLLFHVGFDEAWYAFDLGERGEQTTWRPLLWPFKAVVPATAALLLFQGVSEFLKSLYAARTGQAIEKHEAVQI